MSKFVLITQTIVNGILIGSVYSLIAVGFTLIFGVIKVVNFAHGELVMLGMYAAVSVFVLLGLNPYVGLLMIVPVFLVAGYFIQKYLIENILDASEDMQIILTFGLMIVLGNLALFLFGADLKGVRVESLMKIVNLFGIRILVAMLIAFFTSIIGILTLYLVIKKTDLGKAIRACADERDGAGLVGINIKRVYGVTFAISSACAAIAGVTLVTFYAATPDRGMNFVTIAIVVTVLGGMGSFIGALIGGLLVGLTESVGQLYLSASLSVGLSYAIVILIMFFRPSGLFGKKA